MLLEVGEALLEVGVRDGADGGEDLEGLEEGSVGAQLVVGAGQGAEDVAGGEAGLELGGDEGRVEEEVRLGDRLYWSHCMYV